MRHVAVAIKTTGPDPKEHRISEIAAIEVTDGILGENLHLHVAITGSTDASQGVPFHEALSRWTKFVGASKLKVHDYYEFKRFLRPECDRAGGGFPIAQGHPVVDTWKLAKERFPRQRHSLEAVTRKLGIERNPAASNALEEARLVALVALKLQDIRVAKSPSPPPVAHAPAKPRDVAITVEPAPAPPIPPSRRSMRERLALCWKVLVGHA